MTRTLHACFKSKIAMALLAIFSLSMLLLSSCTKKKENNDGAKFVGSWNGTASCGGTPSAGTLTISAGSNGGTVTTAGDIGTGACNKAVTYNLAASGNNLTSSQTLTDVCGNSYNVNISATLSGSTLTLTLVTTGAVTGTCTFTGTK